MLETVREFALERLVEAREQPLIQAAHAAYFTAFAEGLYPYRVGPGDSIDDRLGRIEGEYPNCRAALGAMADTEAAGVLQLAGALVVFWYLRGHLREGQQWLEWALAHTAETSTGLRSRALTGLGYMVWSRGQHEHAAKLAQAGLAIAEQIGDKDLAARALHMLGLVGEFQCQWDQAGSSMERALNLWRELDMAPEVSMVLMGLSIVAYGLGDTTLSTGRAEESLAITRALGHAFGSAMALNGLARLARDRGDDDCAAATFREALHLWASIGDRETIVQPLAGLAELASVYEQPETAATLVGAVDALAQEAGDFILERCIRFAGDNRDRAGERARVPLSAKSDVRNCAPPAVPCRWKRPCASPPGHHRCATGVARIVANCWSAHRPRTRGAPFGRQRTDRSGDRWGSLSSACARSTPTSPISSPSSMSRRVEQPQRGRGSTVSTSKDDGANHST